MQKRWHLVQRPPHRADFPGVGRPACKSLAFLRNELFEFFDVRVRNLMFNRLERCTGRRHSDVLRYRLLRLHGWLELSPNVCKSGLKFLENATCNVYSAVHCIQTADSSLYPRKRSHFQHAELVENRGDTEPPTEMR